MSSPANSYAKVIESRVTRAALQAAGRGLGVAITGSSLKLYHRCASASLLFRSDHIVLERIGVEATQRRRRFGSALLDVVTAIADAAGLRLALIAEPPLRPEQEDLCARDLQAWYRRRRFVDEDGEMMSRQPDCSFAELQFQKLARFGDDGW